MRLPRTPTRALDTRQRQRCGQRGGSPAPRRMLRRPGAFPSNVRAGHTPIYRHGQFRNAQTAEACGRASASREVVRRGGGEGGRICCDLGPDLSGSWQQRPLCHVQCPVANLSRLQRILPIARSELQFRASVPAVYVTGTARPMSRALGGRGPYYRSAGERWAQAPHF